MNKSKAAGMIGMAMKAGKVASGEFSTEKAVKEGRAWLVVVAENASANTKKKFSNMCSYYGVPICYFADKEQLGRVIGREFRASLAVTDENLAKAVLKQLGD